MKYFVGSVGFNSKNSVEDYVRCRFKNIGYRTVTKSDTELFSFMTDVLKNHHDYESKVGVGIDCYILTANPVTNRDFHTCFRRVDGSVDNFSWISCCNFRSKSVNEKLTRSMREAISEQTLDFRNKSMPLLVCSECKTTDSSYHVDHVVPFRDLKLDFLRLTKQTHPKDFSECKLTGLTKFSEVDSAFKRNGKNTMQKMRNFRYFVRDVI